MSVTLYRIYMKWHKNSKLKLAYLSSQKQLNFICDTETKRYLRFTHKQKLEVPYLIILEGWICTIRGTNITGNTHLPLSYRIGYKSFSCLPRGWNIIQRKTFNNINWEAVGNGMRQEKLRFRIWYLNHMSHFWGTGNMIKIMGSWDNNRCPCCQYEHETTKNLQRLPKLETEDTFKHGLGKLEKLEQMDTAPQIIPTITS